MSSAMAQPSAAKFTVPISYYNQLLRGRTLARARNRL